MKQVTLITLLLVLCSAIGACDAYAQSAINVNIGKIRNNKGVCCVLLFTDPSAFPGDAKRAIASKVIKAEKGVRNIRFEKIPPGTYAIAVIHDENEDGLLNTNFLGIPKEGYGASNNNLPMTSAPKFSGSSFTISGKDKTLEIGLKYY